MILLHPGHSYSYEMECVLRLFYPGAKIDIRPDGDRSAPDCVVAEIRPHQGGLLLEVACRLGDFDMALREKYPSDTTEARLERALGRLLYRCLCHQTGIKPPWGVLTGVRPARLCRSLREAGMSDMEIRRFLTEDCLATEEKAHLALKVMVAEQNLLEQAEPDGFSLYVGIPFCPSRCLYCSFVSHDIRGAAKLVPDYVDTLCREIRYTAGIAAKLGLRLRTVYMGGGTPTTLEADQLERIMDTIGGAFDLSSLREYTVEAGRPDTLTPEKLKVLRRMGADRVSVNPQTMDDTVLKKIGRNHTALETVEGVAMARDAGFECVNMDLIAGLPGDTVATFESTLDRIVELRPENVTLHTLTVKRSSRLREMEDSFSAGADVARMLELGSGRFAEAGYAPYYLYRQKGTLQNLENVGYTLPGKEGLYNVLIMEEAQSILAVGAGAVTKLVLPGKQIRRVYNFKYPFEYLDRFDQLLARKADIEKYYLNVEE